MSTGCAGVFARPLQHLRSLRGQRFQVHARALVAAVLGPHHGEDAQLGQVRLAAEKRDDAVVLIAFQPVAFENLGINHVSSRAGDQPGRSRLDRLHHRLENHQSVGASKD